jgi:hypothetical protein
MRQVPTEFRENCRPILPIASDGGAQGIQSSRGRFQRQSRVGGGETVSKQRTIGIVDALQARYPQTASVPELVDGQAPAAMRRKACSII